jgi:hypothetical protein
MARRLLLLAAVAVMVSAACLGPPALPMPPPAEPEMEPAAEAGYYRLSGRVPRAKATVVARNWTRIDAGDTDFSFISHVADSNGRYDFAIRAEPEDECELYYEWYERRPERSQSRWFRIPGLEEADSAAAEPAAAEPAAAESQE